MCNSRTPRHRHTDGQWFRTQVFYPAVHAAGIPFRPSPHSTPSADHAAQQHSSTAMVIPEVAEEDKAPDMAELLKMMATIKDTVERLSA